MGTIASNAWRGVEIADGIELYVNEQGTYLRLKKKIAPPVVRRVLSEEHIPVSSLEAIGMAIRNLGQWVLLGPPVNRDGHIEIHVSPNKQEVHIVYHPPLGNGKPLTVKDVVEELEAKGIKKYDLSLIEEALSRPRKKTLVGMGKPPERGKDAEVIVRIDPDKPVEISATENVDWHSISSHVFVSEGDVIIEKVPPTPGIPGEDVFGEPIPPRPGKDVNLQIYAGEGTEVTPDGLRVVAKKSGILRKVYGKYVVEDTFVVNGDVNYEVGNITNVQNVRIYGDVLPGFKVIANGDVYIQGSVTDATIEAGGNIEVQGRITCKTGGYVKAGGNVLAKEIVSAKVEANGHVVVEDVLMQSTVHAGGAVYILSRARGRIVGGEVMARDDIVTPILGNDRGTNTHVGVGIDPIVKEHFETLSSEVVELKKKLMDVEKDLTKARNLGLIKKVASLEEEEEQLRKQYQQLKEEYEYLLAEIKSLRSGKKIYIKDRVYPKVHATFYDTTFDIDRIYENCVLTCDESRNLRVKPWQDPPPIDIVPSSSSKAGEA